MTDQPAEKTTDKPETTQEQPSQSIVKRLDLKPINPPLILPLVPIREGVLFPSTESVLTFGRPVSLSALNEITPEKNLLVLVTQKDPRIDIPQPSDLHQIGSLVVVEKKLTGEDGTNALVRGIARVKIVRYLSTAPKYLAEVERLADTNLSDDEIKALSNHLQKEFRKAVHMGKPVEFLNFMKLMGGVTEGELTDQIASTLSIDTLEKQQILETLDVKARLKLVIQHLSHELKILEIEKDVVHKTQERFDKHMRDSVLRERLRTIQQELGELEDEEEVVSEYQAKLQKMAVSESTKEKIQKEIRRLKQMSPNNPETGYIRSWLDTVFELPWGHYSRSQADIKTAKKVLEQNHYGLEKVKDRILEYIAVLSLRQQQAKTTANSKKTKPKSILKPVQATLPTILCFVGPPGVGKTSIGRSIAESLGREFVKVSLGGIRDEAEIRGHRRTYVGAMPGRIISGIKQAKTMNPVFMLDEIDKIGTDFRGDPSSALLEALDPEQNREFSDHYLDLPFDLSGVIFITTANTTDTIPPALKDRLEIIRYAGYTQLEKFEIAKRHLLPKVISANGLDPQAIGVADAALTKVIERYTREAGVRSLERTLSELMRKMARRKVELPKKPQATKITAPQLKSLLGPEKFDVGLAEKTNQIGLATGLAWTSVGGDVLFIEAALTPGKGLVRLTGTLGDVMKESAHAALTWVKANANQLKISEKLLQKTDVHIHVPEGAVPKDGPSAGVTITTAIVSAFTKRPVRREIAMTGEVTLRGRVLRIGGLKEKSIAAHRAGCKVIIIPQENKRDLVEIPKTVTADIKFIPVSDVKEVLDQALEK